MKITARHVAAAYECLSRLPPFSGWGLPPAEKLSFGILRTTNWQGDFYEPGRARRRRKPRIRLSASRVSYADRLLAVTAHEMVHLKTWLLGKPVTHGPHFRALANEVCAQLGFDPKEF